MHRRYLSVGAQLEPTHVRTSRARAGAGRNLPLRHAPRALPSLQPQRALKLRRLNSIAVGPSGFDTASLVPDPHLGRENPRRRQRYCCGFRGRLRAGPCAIQHQIVAPQSVTLRLEDEIDISPLGQTTRARSALDRRTRSRDFCARLPALRKQRGDRPTTATWSSPKPFGSNNSVQHRPGAAAIFTSESASGGAQR
jgi:hypothetical protein